MSEWKETSVGRIPKHWDCVEFIEVGDLNEKRPFISGPFGSSISAKFFVDTGIPVIRGNNLEIGLSRFKDDGFAFLTEEKANELGTYAQVDDIVFTAAGTIGQVGIIEKQNKYSKYIISNKQLRARLNKEIVNPLFCFYWFSSPIMTKKIIKSDTGSTIPLINLTVLKTLPLPLPPKKEQDEIVKILNSIDKKITLLRQQNRDLEELAQILFKRWFVEFEFPNEQGEPYKSSGGSMVESELGEIPEGWRMGTIDEIADLIDPHPSHRAPKVVDKGFPFAGIGDIDSAGNVNMEKARTIDEEYVLKQERDYNIDDYSIGYGRVGTVGKVVRLRKQEYRYALSPTMAVINTKNHDWGEFVYSIITSSMFFKEVQQKMTGTTRPTIGIQMLRTITTLLPDDRKAELIKTFSEMIRPGYRKIDINNKEIRTLTQLRDTLLPKLMNGELRVKM